MLTSNPDQVISQGGDPIRQFSQEATMSLQRIDVYQKAEPAFTPSGFMNNLSEVIKADEDFLIRDAPRLVPDDVLERPIPDTLRPLRTGRVDSEKWCGDQRTKYAVLKVEVTSFVLAVICVVLALVFASVTFPNAWALIGP
jgi:hypothetical protein